MPPFTSNQRKNGNFFWKFPFLLSSCRHFVDSLTASAEGLPGLFPIGFLPGIGLLRDAAPRDRKYCRKACDAPRDFRSDLTAESQIDLTSYPQNDKLEKMELVGIVGPSPSLTIPSQAAATASPPQKNTS